MMAIKSVSRWVTGILWMSLLLAWPFGAATAADKPEQVRIALMYSVGPEGVWDKLVQETLDKLAGDKPHGLSIEYDEQDAVYGEQAESVMRLLAKSGKYDIILSASAHSDQIKNLQSVYPEIMWVSLGSGNYNAGENHYLVYARLHEAAYLLGILAAGISKTGVIGAVGSFPADDINDQLHAFRAGARTVNPDVKMKLTFIESWYDPPKAIEATYAQAAAGADVVYQMAGEVFEACEVKQIYCLSKYKDTSSMAPDVVLSGTQLHWEPGLRWILDEWYTHKTTGQPFAGNEEPVWFSMAEGGSDISPYHGLADMVPDELKKRVADARAAIVSGALEVPVIIDVPKPD
ncbi:MAG: BMP family protein [Rhodobacteraceae bacterium]|nr:BMP family protein [Paracoccaceae bacterium]MCY4136947.1 BMP family protein [Paracoccaceae bacterium]